MNRRVWFHRTCAVIWILLLIPAYLWWRESVFFVITASIYANVKSDWAASEAADDRQVMAAIDEVMQRLDDVEMLFCRCIQCRNARETGPHTNYAD